MFTKDMHIKGYDDELWTAMEQESTRQEEHIELIASENYTSPRVMEAQGSVLTNKYAEGYPSKRYYGGCEYVDIAENLAFPIIARPTGSQNNWRSTVPRPCSVPIMPMSSRTPVPRPTPPCTWPCASPVIPSWA